MDGPELGAIEAFVIGVTLGVLLLYLLEYTLDRGYEKTQFVERLLLVVGVVTVVSYVAGTFGAPTLLSGIASGAALEAIRSFVVWTVVGTLVLFGLDIAFEREFESTRNVVLLGVVTLVRYLAGSFGG